ncbi:SHOCT domain-containing protein [Streptomyces sp. NPDC006339]|uniref:SHOCT domain-containing protein n=1 Tax=Streptomyces sp. NPDC006339 TaxID=3156755 RepID=UPI0033AE68B7
MFLRRRPLVRPVVRPVGAPLLRGALVGGAAYAAGRGAARTARQAPPQETTAQPAPAPAPSQSGPPPTASWAEGGPSIPDQLARLGDLAQQGLLTPEEFAAAKAKLLGT